MSKNKKKSQNQEREIGKNDMKNLKINHRKTHKGKIITKAPVQKKALCVQIAENNRSDLQNTGPKRMQIHPRKPQMY